MEWRVGQPFSLPPCTVAVLASPGELATIVDVLIEQSRHQHLNDQEAARHRKRGVSLSELPNGMFRLVGLLETVAGQRLREALVGAMDRAQAGDVRSRPDSDRGCGGAAARGGGAVGLGHPDREPPV